MTPSKHESPTVVSTANAQSTHSLLVDSYVTRLNAALLLNTVTTPLDYEKGLLLSEEMSEHLATLHTTKALQRAPANGFAVELATLLLQRSLIGLHIPFAVQNHPKSAFSHNLCLKTTLCILDRLTLMNEQVEVSTSDLLVNLVQTSGVMLRTLVFQAVLFLCHELLQKRDSRIGMFFEEFRPRLVTAIKCFVKVAEERLKSDIHPCKTS